MSDRYQGDRYKSDRYQSDHDHHRDRDRDRRPRDDYRESRESRDHYSHQSNHYQPDHYQPNNYQPNQYRPHDYDERPRDSGGYTFRGAAERELPHRRPQENFTFNAPGPAAPRFSPDVRQSHPPPHQTRFGRAEESRRRPPPGSRTRGVAANGYRGRGGFRARPAHNRDILSKTGRETTPELLEGMYIDGERRFREVESSSGEISDDGGTPDVIDLTRDSDSDVVEVPRKRIKVNSSVETAVPKWSNPDPYTVLPPPETLGAPKKDIVQVIRKAKVDAAPRVDVQDAAKENADFISLNFDDDFGGDSSSDENDAAAIYQPPSDVPKASSGFSHRDQFHEKLGSTRPTQQAQPSSFAPRNQQLPPLQSNYTAGGPPAPPSGLIMPTDQEMVAKYAGRGQGKKRKHEVLKPQSGEFDILEEWEPHYAADPTPWCNTDHSRTVTEGLRLHKEICDFHEFVRPYQYEEAVRQELIKRIEHAMRQASGIKGAESVQIKCFGSFAAGLYLPTADMDLVAVSPEYLRTGRKSFCQTGTQMHKLANHLRYLGIASQGGLAVITKSKVPIIKFIDRLTGIKVDISFENDSGLIANQTFETWKSEFPAMPVVVVLIKQLLAMRGLNEVFSGGIGGFTIICLVVSMMQLMPELQSGALDPELHYDQLLLNFLELYGGRFDMRVTGITMDPAGYFSKIDEPRAMQNAKRLTIMDPNRADNDISGGSHKIEAVLDCFRFAHSALSERLSRVAKGQDVEASVLGCVWGGNYTSFIRQREKLSMLQRGYAVSPPPPPPAPKAAPKPASKPASKPAAKPAAKPAPRYKGKPQKQWEQPMTFVPAQHASLPARPAAQAQHALPPKPSSATRAQDRKAVFKASVKEQTKGAKNGGSASAKPAPMEKPAPTEKKERKKARRARQLKAQFPDIPNVPDLLTVNQVKGLSLQHGFTMNEYRSFKMKN
ncbi:hypothetical protein LTR08_001393 [Meristemomyces frigidus]|nr:hypothetical protein LTR08_001393 [Meristemomyces frigidus]